jgi:hypothetical protein
MKVTYTKKAEEFSPQYARLLRASQLLEMIIGPSANSVDVEWDRVEDDKRRSVYTLRVSDRVDQASTKFEPEELELPTHMRLRLHQLWGDLLQARNHRQLAELRSGD